MNTATNTTTTDNCPPGWSSRGEMQYYPGLCFEQKLLTMGSCIMLVAVICVLIFVIIVFLRNLDWWKKSFIKYENGKRRIVVKMDLKLCLAMVYILPFSLVISAGTTGILEIAWDKMISDRVPIINFSIMWAEISFQIAVCIWIFLLARIFIALVVSVPVKEKIDNYSKKMKIVVWIFAVVMVIRTIVTFMGPLVNPDFPIAALYYYSMGAYAATVTIVFGIFGMIVIRFLKKDISDKNGTATSAYIEQTKKAIKRIGLITNILCNMAFGVSVLCFVTILALQDKAQWIQNVCVFSAGSTATGLFVFVFTWHSKKITPETHSGTQTNSTTLSKTETKTAWYNKTNSKNPV